MTEIAPKRRITALMMADVVGYSRLVGLDESGTVKRVRQLRQELLEPAIAARAGRLVKAMGDGFLAEFASVVDATACAVEIQENAERRINDSPDAEPLRLRIGVHVGDVLVEGDDLFGDGVNIVARLEGVAEPGSICLSDDAYRLTSALRVLAPVRNEAPLQQIERALARRLVLPDDENFLRRCAVPAARIVREAAVTSLGRERCTLLHFPNELNHGNTSQIKVQPCAAC